MTSDRSTPGTSSAAAGPTGPTTSRSGRATASPTRSRRALGLGRVHLLGHSWGTALAVDTIRRHGDDGVRSLVLAGPFLATGRYLADAAVLVAALDAPDRAAIADAVASGAFDSAGFNAANDAFNARHLARRPSAATAILLRRMVEGTGSAVYNAMWGPSEFICTGSLRDLDLTATLPTLRMPVLFLAGAHDTCTPATTRAFASTVPNATAVVIGNAGHLTTIDAPDDTVAAIRQFLHRHD